MKKHLLRAALLSASLSALTHPAWATSTTISSNSTTALTLNTGDSLTVASTGTLSVSGSTVAVTVNGNSTITNSGVMKQTGSGRVIRSLTSGNALTITNNAGATITAAGSDAFQMKVTGSVTLNNYGTISTTHADESTHTSGTGDQPVNLNILNADGTTTSYSNTVNNYSGGSISAYEADAVRPGAGGTINNSGTILSTNASDNTSSSDGVDAQVNNTGVTIVNGAGLGTGGANLIEGARHGITGGQQVDTAYTAGTSNGNMNGVYDLPFSMSITNNAGATIQGDNGSGVNIDGVDATEKVTIVNKGSITGSGQAGDGDGVDVDGVVNINNSGTILSKDAHADTSEGITVGGGTIINSGTIEGSVTTAGTTSGSVGRGITLAGIDHTETNGTETDVPIQKIYANPFGADGVSSNPSGATYVTNNTGGLIKGDTDAGIAIAGSATTGTNYAVIITNNAGATIEGNSSTVAAIDGSAAVGGSVSPVASPNNETVIDYGTIQNDGTGKAISLGSGTNSVQILGGSASINADISGGTSAGSNTLTIDPTSGHSFSYSHVLSNFNSVQINSGTVTLSGANIYTGTTTVAGGKLAVDGSVAGNVAVQAGAEVGGHGSVAGAISGAGSVGPGDGPGAGLGILTAPSTSPAGLSYNFEFTQAGAPAWNLASASGNDVLHLTLANPFASGLSTAGGINLYFNQASAAGVLYLGGFFTNGSTDNLTSSLTGATFNYYLLDNANGTHPYNGNEYDLINGQVIAGTQAVTGANFAGGTVASGWTESFTVSTQVVPEPSTWALLAFGALGLIIAARRRESGKA